MCDINLFYKLVIALLTVLLVGTMFFSTNCIVDNYILPKWYCFILFGLSGGLYLACAGIRDKLSVSFDYLDLFILGFVLYLIIRCNNALFSVERLNLFCFILALLLFRKVRTYSVMISILFVILGVVESCYGVLQYFDVFRNPSVFPMVGSFDNPAGFAASVTVVIPFCFVKYQNSIWNKFRIVSGLFIFAALVISGSRAAVLSVLLPFALRAVYLKRKTINTMMIAIFVLLFIFVIFGLFYYKYDSSLGRLLIWEISLDMFKDSPLLGRGGGAFYSEYMLYQADFFKNNLCGYSDLADNVNHPFCEYLLLICEYGLVAFVLFVICAIMIVKKVNNDNIPYFMSFFSVMIFALFSYPLRYPFVIIVLAFVLSNMMVDEQRFKKGKVVFYGVLSTCLLAGYLLIKDINFECRWNKLTNKMLFEDTDLYGHLYTRWNGNPYFLYNYGAILNNSGCYAKSNVLLEICTKYLNNYDVQMLLADNYYQLGVYGEAEQHFILASQMCPNRFMPLYKLTILYDSLQKSVQADSIAGMLINKNVKIHSTTIDRIKAEMYKRFGILPRYSDLE